MSNKRKKGFKKALEKAAKGSVDTTTTSIISDDSTSISSETVTRKGTSKETDIAVKVQESVKNTTVRIPKDLLYSINATLETTDSTSIVYKNATQLVRYIAKWWVDTYNELSEDPILEYKMLKRSEESKNEAIHSITTEIVAQRTLSHSLSSKLKEMKEDNTRLKEALAKAKGKEGFLNELFHVFKKYL